MKPNLKLEIVDAILGKVNAAIETTGDLIYADSKKVFLDLVPHVKLEEYMATLKELKKAGSIKDFENKDDCFYIHHPSQSKLYEIRRSLSSPTEQKSDEKPLKLSFDANSGKIIWGDKECELPLKKMEILSPLGSNLSLMDKKLSISLENSLVPLKTVSLVSGQILSKVRTAKNPVNKTEIEQSLARSQSMLPLLDVFRTMDWKQIEKERSEER